jgi:hypothetical protein
MNTLAYYDAEWPKVVKSLIVFVPFYFFAVINSV